MATKVQLKRGSGAPATSALATGEVAIDTTNKRIYTSTNGTDIVELAANPAAEIQANAGIALPDNQKATFGASDDLQIYHDGSHSYISDTGTGDLFIKGDNNLWLRSATDENYIRCDTDGAVWLYYDNANKLTTTSTGIDVTGEITADGLSLGDSEKATFGTSDDLQIYHDGSHSYVRDMGTGNLRILGTDVDIRNSGNSASLIKAIDGGSAYLYENGTLRLATTSTGIDVTGTVVADGLTVDGDAEFIGNAISLDFMESDQVDKNLRIRANGGVFSVQTLSDDKGTQTNRLQVSHTTGDISFYEDTGTTAKFFWDASAESLGIGTSSPNAPLTVIGGGVAEFRAGNIGPSSNSAIRISRNDTTVSSGNPLGYLEFGGNDSTSNIDTAFAYISAEATNSHAAGDNPTALTFGVTADNTATTFEAMRIDSSGNLLVGKTTSALATVGHELQSNGNHYVTKDGGVVQKINRLTSDGDITEFYKDGSKVGSIGTLSGDLTVGTGITGIHFKDASDAIIPYNVSTGADRNGDIDLGLANNRFKDLYLSGGVYVGGTGAANKLDDYEEGTWTPSADYSTTNATAGSTTGTGTYTKVGNTVTIWATLSNIKSTGASGDLKITGLPFAAKSNASLAAAEGTIWAQHLSVNASCYGIVPELEDGASAILIREMISASTTDYIDVADISDSVTDIRLTLTYEV